jgi:hypothetical protein
VTDFENELRRQLTEVGDLAPTFQPTRGVEPSAPKRRRSTLAFAGVALAVAGAGVWWTATRATVQRPEALCVAAVSFEGKTYQRHGDLARIPRATELLGQASPIPCSDDPAPSPVGVRAAAGYSPDELIMVHGSVWVRDGAPVASVKALSTPVKCSDPAGFTAQGRITGVDPSGGSAANDEQLVAPFTVGFEARQGPAWLVGEYQAVHFDAVVQPTTQGADSTTVQAAITQSTQVRVHLRCNRDQFEAVALTHAE